MFVCNASAVCIFLLRRLLILLFSVFQLTVAENSLSGISLYTVFFTAFCGLCASALSGLITKVSSFCLSLFPETPVFFLVLEVFLLLCSEYYAFSLSHYVHHALILAKVTSIFLRVIHCSRILILNRI